MTVLVGGRLADGSRADVRVDPATGTVVAVAPGLEPAAGEEVVDVAGSVVLDAPVEPHAHLDKAGTWAVAPNPEADLASAVRTWATSLVHRSADEILATARPVLDDLVSHGATAVRSHVNLSPATGWAPLDALLALKEEAARTGVAELQVVAMPSMPVTGAAGAHNLQVLDGALARGADLAGGAPHADPDPVRANAEILALADRHGVGVDLHVDEALRPEARGLEDLAHRVAGRGWPLGHATASHCVSLGVQDADDQERVAAAVAAARLSVVACPQTNLYLQGRGRTVAVPRGLTAVRTLLAAGANVAGGGDNVRDAFNAVGRADPLDTAALLVMAAHLTPTEAWHAVGAAGRAAMGLPPAGPVVGLTADLVCLPGADLADALARAQPGRIVLRRGRVVARTTVQRSLGADAASAGRPGPVPAAPEETR